MIALHAPPAIIVPRPETAFRLYVNGEDCGPCLPRDFRAMPRETRLLVNPRDLHFWLPEPYRKLSAEMLASVLMGNLPGLPGAIMAGAVRSSYLYTASDTFFVSADWNPVDNIVHGVGRGGKGGASVFDQLTLTNYAGGGGGGAAYANKLNVPGRYGDQYGVIVATTSGDTSFNGTDYLLAKSGSDGGTLSGGTASGGSPGAKGSCIGDSRSSGSSGQSVGAQTGGVGGAAGGPHGDADAALGYGGVADADYGGFTGTNPDWDVNWVAALQSGVYPNADGSGWNPNVTNIPNAGSGGGGSSQNDGGLYGGGGSGANGPGTAGNGAIGCVLIVNNRSL
jgi:hypothetical protein